LIEFYYAIHLIDNTLLSEKFSNENLYLRKHFGIFGQNFINWVLLLHWDLIFVFL